MLPTILNLLSLFFLLICSHSFGGARAIGPYEECVGGIAVANGYQVTSDYQVITHDWIGQKQRIHIYNTDGKVIVDGTHCDQTKKENVKTLIAGKIRGVSNKISDIAKQEPSPWDLFPDKNRQHAQKVAELRTRIVRTLKECTQVDNDAIKMAAEDELKQMGEGTSTTGVKAKKQHSP